MRCSIEKKGGTARNRPLGCFLRYFYIYKRERMLKMKMGKILRAISLTLVFALFLQILSVSAIEIKAQSVEDSSSESSEGTLSSTAG